MKNICEWENCNEIGGYKAPLEKDNSKSYKWLCEEHVKLFNKSWDYFDGMNQAEIENLTLHGIVLPKNLVPLIIFLIFYGTML